MADPIERLELQVVVDSAEADVYMYVRYNPVVNGELRHDLQSSFRLPDDISAETAESYVDLQDRYRRLESEIQSLKGTLQLEIEGRPVTVIKPVNGMDLATTASVLSSPSLVEGEPPFIHISFLLPGSSPSQSHRSTMGSSFWAGSFFPSSDLPEGQARLVDSILTTLTSHSWNHFRTVLSMNTATKPEVFISYRKGHETFAKALAERLGREGFVPWFDEWEVLAGDSIPGKIEDGLRRSIAFIPVITNDYGDGRWANEELQTALTKRVEEDYAVIPVMLDDCQKPELIRQLRHVDFCDHDPEKFESRVAEVIDGINRLTRNPFR